MRVPDYHLPTVIQRAEGVFIYDADDNELIDLNMGYGPLIFGHRSPVIVTAIERELKIRGTILGFPHELSHQAAELIIKSFPSIEKLRFTSTGTEAVQTAVRLARAFTGRKKIILFEGHYHGSSDAVFHAYHARVEQLEMNTGYSAHPGTGGMGGSPSNAYVLPWNDIDLLQSFLLKHNNEIAAVIMEPVMGNAGTIPPEPFFLQKVRELTTQAGSLLIFDEIITGFRIARGGAQERFGVKSDITLLSKAMSGGVPAALVGGREEIIDLLTNRKVFHGGVYSGNPMCMAASLAAQQEFDNNHKEIYSQLEITSKLLASGIREIFKQQDIPVLVQNVGAMLNVWFLKNNSTQKLINYRQVCNDTDPGIFIRFQHLLQNNGVYVHPNHYEPWYLSTCHTQEIIARVLTSIEQSAKELKRTMNLVA